MPVPPELDLSPAFEDFDAWHAGLPPLQQEAITRRFAWTPPEELESERRRFLSIGLISQRTGQEVEEVGRNLETIYLPAYSRDPRGLGMLTPPADVNGFFAAAKGKMAAEKAAKEVEKKGAEEGFRAAIEDQGGLSMLSGMADDAMANPDQETLNKAKFQAYRHTSNVLAPYRSDIQRAGDAYERIMTGAPRDGDEALIDSVRERLLDIPDAERPLVLASFMSQAKAKGEMNAAGKSGRPGIPFGGLGAGRGFLQQIGESAARFGESAVTDSKQMELMIDQVPDSGDVRFSGSSISTPAEARKFVSESIRQSLSDRAALEGAGPGGAAMPTMDSRPSMKLDTKAAELVKEAKSRALKGVQVDREFRQIANSTDPVTNVFASAIGTSATAMLAMGVSRGGAAPILAKAYSNIEYDELSLKYPAMPAGDKALVAGLSGGIQSALDYVGLKFLDKLPGLKSLIAQPLTRQLAGRAAARTGLTYLQENIVEGGQDAATPLLMQALASDVPGYDWGTEMKEWWGGRADVALGMIPLTLLGIGAASVREYTGAKELLSQYDRVRQTGVPEGAAVEVVELARAGKLEEAQARLQSAWGERDSAAAKEAQAAEDARQAEQTAAVDELTRLGMLPSFSIEKGKVTVRDGENVATFNSWEEARAVATQHMTEMERHQADLVASMADSFISGTPETLKGESFDIQQGGETLGDRVRTGAITPEQAMEAAVAGGVLKGLTVAEARQIASDVFGESQDERMANMRQAVEAIQVLGRNTVEGGQSKSTVNLKANERAFLTVVEEGVEGRWQAGLAAKRFTPEQGQRFVAIAEAATGEKFMKGEGDRALTEALSRIVVADVLGRMKDGRRIGPGSISRGLDLNDRDQGALAAILSAFRQFFKAILKTAAKLAKARAEGKLGAEYDQLFDELTGGGGQHAHEQGALKEAESMAAEASSETFSLANLNQAEEHLRSLAGKPLTTSDGLTATVSNATAAKMASASAVRKSVSPAAHLAAIENFEGLFARGAIKETTQDRANDPNIGAIQRVYSPMDGGLTAKFTVKEFTQPGQGNRIYSIEAMDLEGAPSAGQSVHDAQKAERGTPITDDTQEDAGNGGQSQESHSLRSGDFAARVDAVFSEFHATPEKRRTLMRVAKDRVQKQLAALDEVLNDRAAAQQALAEAEIKHAEAVAKLRDSLEADEKEIRAGRDLELGGVSRDKGTELDRERIRRAADNDLKDRRIAFERDLATLNEKRSSAEAKGERQLAAADRSKVKGIMRVLDAALSSMPAEVRGKISYFTLADQTDDTKMLATVEKKIRKMDQELERWLKKDFKEAIEKLLQKGAPKSESGKKATGKDADLHALFAAAGAAQDMNAEAVAGELARLDALLAADTITPEQEILLTTQRGLVELLGDFKNADSARMEAALETLQYIYTDRWLKWKLSQIEKRERRAGLKHALITDTGKTGVRAERVAAETEAKTLLGATKEKLLSLSSFHEVLNYAFGSDSQTSTALVDAEREASGQYEDANQKLGDDVQDLFTKLAGGSVLDGEKLRFSLSQQSIKTDAGTLSQLQGVQALLMWAQEDGKRHMQGSRDEEGKPVGDWHYDQAWIDNVEAQLTPDARKVMAWIKAQYAGEYATLNPLYRQRYGVNLPGHDHYAPITVTPQKTKGTEVVDPVTGQAVASGSVLTPGSLRTRSSSAIAEPDFRDALQTFMMHRRKLEYWRHYYDLAVEMQAVLADRSVMNAVSAKGGPEASSVLRKWIEAIASGGFRDAAAGLAMNQGGARMMSRAATVALYGRVSTLLVQATQLAAAGVQMPTGAYLYRFGKLMSGNLDWSDSLKSDFIQRRFRSAPPIVRQTLDSLAAAKEPNQIKRLTHHLGQLISGADALFTSGTFAILRDYHMQTGRAMGLTGAELEAHATREAERATEQVAQPTRMAARSLMEITNTTPLGRAGWAFSSEARQKIALMGWALANAKRDKVRAFKVAFLTFGVGGLMSTVMKNVWREMKGDDDEDKWSPQRLAISAISGPLHGIPFAGDFLEDGGMFSSVMWAKKSALDIMEGEGDLRDVDTLLSAAGLLGDTFAGIAALGHVGIDAAKLLTNLADD